jgi:hypothetical protein
MSPGSRAGARPRRRIRGCQVAFGLGSHGITRDDRSVDHDSGRNPVTAVRAQPKIPFTTVAPVLVTVEPARTAKVLAVPGTGLAFRVAVGDNA